MNSALHDAAPPEKILLILHGAIGDVTRALPLAQRIKRAWPASTLVWAVEPRSKGVLLEHPAIDRLIVFDRPRGFRAYVHFISELRAEKPDVVLDLQRIFKSGLTSWLTGASRRLGFHRRNAKEFNWLFNTETIDPVENFSSKFIHYQSFGDALGLPELPKLEFGLQPSPHDIQHAEKLLSISGVPPGNRVALILGSSWESRVWPEEHYLKVIRTAHERFGMHAYLVGAQQEVELANAILAASEGMNVTNLVAETTLQQLAAVFARVRLAVGSDSGPMHIAAAVGLPIISLWGSTSPLRSAPVGSEEFALQSPIGCSPCYKRECPGLDRACMADIPHEAVIAQMERILSSPEAQSA